MRRLTQAPNLAIAMLWVHVLREEGIAASVQREFLNSVAGEVPFDQCLPEVWIDEAQDHERAWRLLEMLRNPTQRRWRCRCGEWIEGGFEQCWNCGAMMAPPS